MFPRIEILLQEYREKGLHVNHNEKYIFEKNFPEYDLASRSALVPDDVGHPFKIPHQFPGDGNCLYKLYYTFTIYLADKLSLLFVISDSIQLL